MYQTSKSSETKIFLHTLLVQSLPIRVRTKEHDTHNRGSVAREKGATVYIAVGQSVRIHPSLAPN